MGAKMLATALVGKSHGIEGFLFVRSLSGKTAHIKKLKSCTLRFSDGRELPVTVEAVKAHGDDLLMRFVGYETPEKAKRLSSAEILVPREEAAPLAKGKVYIADLYGLDVLFDGEVVGVVEATSEGSQAELLHIRGKKDGKIHLVPYMQPFCNSCNLELGNVELLMKELLEN